MGIDKVEEHLEQEFHISWYIIIYKLAFGLAEFLLGLGIVLFGKSALNLYRIYLSRELLEDPHDLLARLTTSVVPSIFTHNTFLVIYLILLGSVKIAGAIGLIYKQNWGVDLLVGLTVLMFPFQFINLVRHPSLPNFIYISVGLLIALYLINFQPQKWATKIVRQFSPPL